MWLCVWNIFNPPSSLRFKHKNPEDVYEVPHGFLSDINPFSKKEIVAYMDNSLAKTAKVYDKFQFERIGFFSVDPDTKPNKVSIKALIYIHVHCINILFYFSLFLIVL